MQRGNMAPTEFQKIIDDFEFLDDWEDRYRYIIDLGKSLEPLKESLKNETTKVDGCASQVWLTYELIGSGETKNINFKGESDAVIVRGLIYIILKLFNGTKINEAMGIDAMAELSKLGLHEHLSSQRSNGIRAMIERIRTILSSI